MQVGEVAPGCQTPLQPHTPVRSGRDTSARRCGIGLRRWTPGEGVSWLQPGAPRCPQSLTGNKRSGPRALERHPRGDPGRLGAWAGPFPEPGALWGPQVDRWGSQNSRDPPSTQPSPRVVRISKPGAPHCPEVSPARPCSPPIPTFRRKLNPRGGPVLPTLGEADSTEKQK